MHLIFGEKKFAKFLVWMNSRRAMIFIFIIYLIPGLPKDPIGYAVGLSKIKLERFLIIALIARTPSLMASILVGSMFEQDSYTAVIIISVVSIILFVLALVYRKNIMKWIDKGG
jgi:uncharacterized membrane protein YdjX (TVP38/TMEM64 family)